MNVAQAARKPALISALITRMVRKPKRRRMVRAAIFMPMAPIAEAKVIRPDWNGVMPKPTCSISGSRNGSAPMPSRKMKPPSTLRAERRDTEQREIERRIVGVRARARGRRR